MFEFNLKICDLKNMDLIKYFFDQTLLNAIKKIIYYKLYQRKQLFYFVVN
jgi:hypothetical protein